MGCAQSTDTAPLVTKHEQRTDTAPLATKHEQAIVSRIRSAVLFQSKKEVAESIGSSMELSPARSRFYSTGQGLAPDFEMTEAHAQKLEQFLEGVRTNPKGFAKMIFRLRALDAQLQDAVNQINPTPSRVRMRL
mmetsp:Transcript_4367/g.10686  ORF Transcript_4367/g.10686 Transcript_4367/m.10686 type:complete len:134 (+) Transcript_4367:77-478(+)